MLWRSCASVEGVKLTLIRSATLRIEYAGQTLLVDPQLDPAGAREAVPNTPNPRRSPLGELPEPPEAVVAGLDAVLVTHLHRDHFDDTAKRLLDKHLPLFCQPHDTERLHADGFTDARPVHADAKLHDILIERTEGQHGTGEIGRADGAGLRLRAGRARGADRLHRRRHDPLRRGPPRGLRPTPPTSSSSTPAPPSSTRAARS